MSHEIIYFGFDMDDTIGYIHQFFSIIAILKPSVFKIDVSEELSRKLEEAYQNFVFLLADTEKRIPYLLNPIVMETLRSSAFSSNRYCMIYSNNSVLELLHFASDLIEAVLDKKIFCAHVHLNHEIRDTFDGSSDNKPKTWATYKIIFTELYGAPEPPTRENSVFFDDLEHPDLMNILGDNYYHIEKYHKRFDERDKYYKESILSVKGLNSDPEFRTYLSNLHLKAKAEKEGGSLKSKRITQKQRKQRKQTKHRKQRKQTKQTNTKKIRR